jgi:hypothetical protein
MKRIGLPYSGEYGFVETEMYWPLNHMVAPKEKSLSCDQCHTSENSRLANLTGFYLPGRDKNLTMDTIGRFSFIMAIVGVIIHGFARFFSNNINLESSEGLVIKKRIRKKN